jgi:hypothetical protein
MRHCTLDSSNHALARTRSTAAGLALFLVAGLLGGCGQTKSVQVGSTAGLVGELVEQPAPEIGSKTFVVDANRRGEASDVRLLGTFWGRLVAVADDSGEIQNRDFVVGENIRTNSIYDVSTNAVTDQTVVTIKFPAGSQDYLDAFTGLDANLTPMQATGLDATGSVTYSMTPRNAAIVLRFDDLLDPRFVDGAWKDSYAGGLVNAATGQLANQVIQIRTGYPPESPFEARVIIDRNHGDLADHDGDGVQEFHTTRVIVASIVTALDSLVADPPLPINALGWPGSVVTTDPNLALFLPTRLMPSVGQTQLLVNATGHALSFSQNGPTASGSATDIVVRSMRAGGSSDITGDLNNGFLADEEAPRLIGTISILVVDAPVADPQVAGRFTLPILTYIVPACSPTPKVGDVVAQGGVQAQVIQFGTQAGTTVLNMVVEVISPIGAELSQGSAQLLTPFNPVQDSPPCFVRFSPNPGSPPNQDISNVSQLVVRFSEPMDPATLTAFDNFSVTRVAGTPTAHDYVIGRVLPSPDLRVFTFAHPDVPFAHAISSAEEYFMNMASGEFGPTDLAGNPLEQALPQVSFKLNPTEGSEINGGLALRFDVVDELFDDTFVELRNGQLLYQLPQANFPRGRIRPRPVTRINVAADVNQPVPSVMTPFPVGVATPLSPLGSKLHALWRYCDLGMSISDETNMNIDIETLSWAPVGGNVVADNYPEFRVSLSTSAWLPDEILNTALFPQWPQSGLKIAYASNFADPSVIVHPRQLGYTVDPSNLYQASSQTTMLPYPLNQTIPKEQFRYYTWRDTALLVLGGLSGSGAPPDQEIAVVPLPPGKTYGAGLVRSVALPLMMEFRCYPENNALGLNAFTIALAANSSARPNFRAFSTGGYNTSGNPIVKNPDTQDTATGGFNPGAGGQVTIGADNSFYIGEAGLVTRISRIHTIWFDVKEQGSFVTTATFAQPVVEPPPADQPSGTEVVLAFRGASNIAGLDNGNPPDDITTNALNLDFYGDKAGPGTPTFLSGTDWKADITSINTAQYFQVRISFISNTSTDQTAELRSLAFAYRQL